MLEQKHQYNIKGTWLFNTYWKYKLSIWDFIRNLVKQFILEMVESLVK